MALERKDVRFKLDPEQHQALTVLADVDGVDIGEWVEGVVWREVERRVHVAKVIASRTARLGKSGKNRDNPGDVGSE